MSVEASVVAAIVEEGSSGLRKLYQAGLAAKDFPSYEEEVDWIENRLSNRKPVNPRIFRQRFSDFDWLPTKERLNDLLVEFRQERAFIDLNTLIETVSNELEVDNAVDKAEFMRDNLSDITRLYAPKSDVLLAGGYKDHLEEQKQFRALRQAGVPPGIPTDIEHLDHHWDGLGNGRMIVILGRPGEMKSYLLVKFGWAAMKRSYRVLMFSPEMNAREHRCRLHTLASADKEVQAELGFEHSFRNRALMNGIGYNIKRYRKFCEYLDGLGGEIILVTGTHRRDKMSVGFIESKIADLGPDLVIIDPIYKLKPTRQRMSKIEELGDISDSLEDLSEVFNIPVVVTNQAHRQGSGNERAPHKDKSYNSDVPIQEADHVIGVKHIEEEHRLLLRCSKSRFGRGNFHFEMKVWPNTGVMYETTSPKGSYYNGKDEDADEDELRDIVDRATNPKRKSREVIDG